MKTPGGATPGSASISIKSTFVKGHPQIGILILTLQELALDYSDADGDNLCCNYNGLMFPKDFMAAVGLSRRVGLLKAVLEILEIQHTR